MSKRPYFDETATPTPSTPLPGQSVASAKSASKPNTERVMKMFTPAEAIAVIKNEATSVTLGHGPEARAFVIQPLSPKQLLGAYKLIQEIILPLATLVRPGQNIGFADLMEALGPNIDKVPELVKVILDRGNNPVSLEWINDNLDILLDLQLIIPAFLVQNGLDKLFAPKGQ